MLTKVLDPDSEQQKKIKFRAEGEGTEGGRGRKMETEGKRDGDAEKHAKTKREMEKQVESTRQSQEKQVTLLDLRSQEIFMDP